MGSSASVHKDHDNHINEGLCMSVSLIVSCVVSRGRFAMDDSEGITEEETQHTCLPLYNWQHQRSRRGKHFLAQTSDAPKSDIVPGPMSTTRAPPHVTVTARQSTVHTVTALTRASRTSSPLRAFCLRERERGRHTRVDTCIVRKLSVQNMCVWHS